MLYSSSTSTTSHRFHFYTLLLSKVTVSQKFEFYLLKYSKFQKMIYLNPGLLNTENTNLKSDFKNLQKKKLSMQNFESVSWEPMFQIFAQLCHLVELFVLFKMLYRLFKKVDKNATVLPINRISTLSLSLSLSL